MASIASPRSSEWLTSGVIPAVPIPFTGAGEIDWSLQEAYVEWMGRQFVSGVAVWAHTGRGLHLTREQRIKTLQSWRAGAPHLRVVCAVGAPDGERDPVAGTLRMVEDAKAGGADTVMVYPPRGLGTTSNRRDALAALHESVVQADVNVLAFYLYEMASGCAYTLEELDDIVSIAGVVGCKVATLDNVVTYQDVVKCCQDRGCTVLTGEDRFLPYSMMLGAQAALVGMGAACTDVTATLVSTWQAQRLTEFHACARRADAFGMATFCAPMEGYVQRLLWALEADDVFPRSAFDPYAPPMPKDERERVFAAVKAIRGRR